jgi:hypothetical protein
MGMIFWYYKIGIFVYFLWLWFVLVNNPDAKRTIKSSGVFMFGFASIVLITFWIPVVLFALVKILTRSNSSENL